MDRENIALLYLAEQTSPENYEMKNLNIMESIGSFFVEFDAVLHSFDVLNINKRIYQLMNVRDCYNKSDEIQSYIRKNGWFGEMDHPGQDFENMQLTAQRVQKIHMPNRSHKIMNPIFNESTNLLTAKIQTASGTDAGIGMAREIVQGLIPSFSCRSVARMNVQNGKPIVSMRKLITYDWVLYPSHKEATMIGKPTLRVGQKEKLLLESANTMLGVEPIFKKRSKDVCIDMSQFSDFKEFISEFDSNTNVVLESVGCDYNDINTFDTNGNIVINTEGNKIFVNTNMKTKKKIEDFLSSF
jgi:hypothetical protein|uniref:Prohead core protein serine protease n=1 Tax=Myoviridae sp. ctXXl13 TaxID=2827691 RepID=A0A8S5TIX5_9CAUD|nr:MAG TPA: Prohead core protein serine protease [Myoviridae sp. ctXXl13]